LSFHRVTIGKSIDQKFQKKKKEKYSPATDHQVIKATRLAKAELLHT